MNSAFWSRLIEAIVAFFFVADMKGMMAVEVAFECDAGSADASYTRALGPTCVRATTESFLFPLCAFPCDPRRWPVPGSKVSRVVGQ